MPYDTTMVKRTHSRMKIISFQYLRYGAISVIFLFWANLIFKSNVSTLVKDRSIAPDNYTKYLLQGLVIGDGETSNIVDWWEPDNVTLTELEKRAVKVQDVCRKRMLLSYTINNKEFFVDHAHNLVWCNIFKAASSYWLYNFNVLAGYDKKFLARTRQTPLILARKKFPRPSEEELRDAVNTPGVISLLVVREPFVRLLSAYRNKLENTPIAPYYGKLARLITTSYRENTIKIFGPNNNFEPTFYEFVTYIIRHYKDKNFTFDEHWAPYYMFCSPCSLNFTLIAKVETLTRDSACVIQKLGIRNRLGKKGRDLIQFRTVMNKSKGRNNTTALLRHYFSQLDEDMLDGLLQIYGLDFEMFGYDAKIYKRYVRK